MGENIIELKDLTVYRGGEKVLDSVTLVVPPGSFYAIIGPNGSGKTTMVKTILGLFKSDSGTVRVFGKKPEQLGKQRSRIGYIPQGFPVDTDFPVTVSEVVMMGLFGKIGLFKSPQASDHQAVADALEKVDLDTYGQIPIGELSGGQLQRVFLARALVSDPDLLILDEPTTGVDVTTSEGFYKLLHRLGDQGVTVILVSHDVGVVARHADLVACLNRSLVEHGSVKEVLTEEVIESMYGEHAVAFPHASLDHNCQVDEQ